MKAIIEFELMDDWEAFGHATKGSTYYCAIEEIAEMLRKNTKYNPKEFSGKQLEAIEQIKEDFYSILSDYEVKI